MESVTRSHQHTRKAGRVMHGLEWWMPLLVELDEFHRSRVIDPNLLDKKSALPQEIVHRDRKDGGRIKGV